MKRLNERQAKLILLNVAIASYPNRDVLQLLKPLYDYVEQVEAENTTFVLKCSELIDETAALKATTKWRDKGYFWECELCRYGYVLIDAARPAEHEINFCPRCGAKIIEFVEEEIHE